MKKLLPFLFAVLIAGCTPTEQTTSENPTVFVSIPPQAGLLKAIVGEYMEVRTLVGEGQSPHAYEPTARQLAALGEADVLFTMGVPFEQALLKKIKPLYPDLPIIGTDAEIIKRSMPHDHHGEHCTHDHGEMDPHVWLSAENAIMIATAMVETLQDIDPENRSAYAANHDELIQTLENLHIETAEQLTPFKGKRFYVFHPSFGYFADAYGLEQVAIEVDGKSPSPRQLGDLIENAKIDGVKVIFVQKQFPMESARAIANEMDGQVVQLDPLAEDVVANLHQIADAIVDSYK